MHDLQENVPNAVPGTWHADEYIHHQSISPNIYIYIMSSFDVIVYDFVLILMTIQLQSTCLNHARI